MKKITSIFLALLLLLCPLVSFAEDEKSNNEFAENALRLLKAADVALVEYPGMDDSVSRETFLCTLVSCLKLSSQQVQYETGFFDVENNTQLNNAVIFATELGIISKTKYFRPKDCVTYSEACKMIVSALGYDRDAESLGGYPSGYLIMAERLKINKNIGKNPGDTLSGAQFYIMLRNMLESDLRVTSAVIQKSGNTVLRYAEKTNILTVIFGWQELGGIINANEHSYLYDDKEKTAKDFIEIGGKSYKCNMDYTMGTNVMGYASEDDGVLTIQYLEEKNNKILNLTPENEPYASGNVIYYMDAGGKTVKVSFEKNSAVIFNGKACPLYAEADFRIDLGSLQLIDNDGNGAYNVVIIKNGDVMHVDSVNQDSKTLYDRYSGTKLMLSGDTDNIIKIDGDKTDFSEISARSVIEYYESKDKSYLEINILQEIVSGKLTAKADKEIYLDDRAYKCTNYFAENFISNLEIGTDKTFTLSLDGKIAAPTDDNTTAMKFGYLYGAKKESEFSDTISVRLFTEGGDIADFETTEKLLYNGTTTGEALQIYDMFKNSGEQLIRYRLNANGKICAVSFENQMGIYYNETDAPDILKRYDFPDYDSSKKISYKSVGLFVPHFSIDKKTLIFWVKDKSDAVEEAERFQIGSMTSWANDKKIPSEQLLAYNVSPAGRAAVLLYRPSAGASDTVTEESSYGVIEKITESIDPYGYSALKLSICRRNKYYACYVSKNSAAYLKFLDADKKFTLKCGDFIRYTVNTNNQIQGLTLDFDSSKRTVLHKASVENALLNYYYGTIFDIDGKSFSLKLLDSSSDTSAENAFFVMENMVAWLVDNEKGTIQAIPFDKDNVITYMQDEADAYKVLLKTRYSAVHDLVFYKD